jgi:endonuclease/exonuclease/phosphatase family metal-dependent hydrolase
VSINLAVTGSTGRDSVNMYFYEGNAILYKNTLLTPVVSDSIKYFAGLKNFRYLGSLLSILRGSEYVKFRTVRNTLLNVFNTHLEVDAIPSVGSGQSLEFRDYIRSKSLGNEAVAVLGDFNDSPTGARVAALLNDNFMDAYNGPAPTCCYDLADTTVAPIRRIDYVLARGIVKVDTADVILRGVFSADTSANRISDHAGVTASLTFH